MTARIAVCVSTRDRAERLRRLLAALAEQSLDPSGFEVVVVDDGSTDDTPGVIDAASNGGALRLRGLRHESSRGPAAGRNAAWRAATADVVAFIDDDCVPSQAWLANLLATIEQGADVVVGAVARNPQQAHRSGPFARELVVGPAQMRWYATANVCYRRRDLELLGGFDEKYRNAAAEDTDLGFRAEQQGLRIAFAADALVFHDVMPGDWRAAVRDRARWADLASLFAAHPEARATTLWHGIFWRQEHAEALFAAMGMLLAPRRISALLFAAPWLHGKLCRSRGEESIPAMMAALPGLFAIDVAETAAAVRGSVRSRTLFL